MLPFTGSFCQHKTLVFNSNIKSEFEKLDLHITRYINVSIWCVTDTGNQPQNELWVTYEIIQWCFTGNYSSERLVEKRGSKEICLCNMQLFKKEKCVTICF